MSRVQLALRVSDLDAAIDFYSKLFVSPPSKIRPGYANFAIADPPLKLVLVESPASRGRGADHALDHLGVEVEGAAQVAQASSRLSGEGLATSEEHGTTCCYAVQDKVWVADLDATPWEIYTVLADAPGDAESRGAASGMCCELRRQGATTAKSCC